MFYFTTQSLPDSIFTLAWYQYYGELASLFILFLSFTMQLMFSSLPISKMQLWSSFLSSSAVLLAFAFITIPWMISEINH